VGLVLPCAVVVGGLLLEGRWRELWRFPWIPGGLLYLALVAPWYVAYAMEAWPGEALHRAPAREREPLPARLEQRAALVLLLRPLPAELPALGRLPARHGLGRAAPGSAGERPALRWIALWFLVVFTFFSASSGKRTVYLLPLFPAVALLVGWTLWTALPGRGKRRPSAFRLSAAPLLFLLGLAAIAMPLLAGRTHMSVRGPAWVATALLGVGAVLLLAPLVRAEPRGFFARCGGRAGCAPVARRARADAAHRRLRERAAGGGEPAASLVPPGARFGSAEPKREGPVLLQRPAGARPSNRRGAGPLPLPTTGRRTACSRPQYWERWGMAHAAATLGARAPPALGESFLLVTNVAR
jgi:hypothetical protein